MKHSDYGLITAPILGGVEPLWREIGEPGLAVNGQLVQASCWFDQWGLNPTAKTWTCRKTGTVLSLAGSGAEPDFAATAPGRPGMKACKLNGGKYLVAPDNVFGKIETEDFLHVALVLPGSAAEYVLAKYDNTNPGWGVLLASTTTLGPLINDGTALGLYATILASSWVLIVAGCNRDEASANGFQVYPNGVLGTSTDPSARSGSLDSAAVPFTIGCRTGSGVGNGSVALYGQYKAANMWAAGATGAAQMLALAQKLTAIFAGYLAAHNHASLVPTLPTRTSAAYSRGF